ncbi:LysM peptidoglycan-binding domain-containing protein [Deinococcus hopiensis]|uniref:Peptidase_C39 like family protein n=1 Tax=Deinococcus hopiensis KR-140 TaxID=695939 RepID=A0A1W1UHP7_9DEIO|nr:LysM peptidoglycan-binding domain-containing protein [Deinococcus hopiensis]SMB80341.1 Peptidase_C39 like family protein [Deinococcus hopiensis KR-140]
MKGLQVGVRGLGTGLAALSLLAGPLLNGAGAERALTSYTVRMGDTVYSLSQRSGTTVSQLLQLNGLRQPVLRVGQAIKLPVTRTGPAAVRPASTHLPSVAAIPARPVAPALKLQLPRPDPFAISAPAVWKATPAPTVASFIGWFPLTDSPIGNALPVRTYLHGLAFNYQTYNNCGPSALSSVLGFYRVKIGQEVIQRTVRPGGGYMQVSAIAPELAKFKLRTLTIRGGKLSQVKRLLALGIPVIVLQWYDRPGHIPHFRVVRGYDDQAGVFWVSDSMVGPLAYLSYRSFDTLWNTQDRKMFPVYPEGYDKAVRELTRMS